MDYLKALRDDPDLAEEFDSLFDFFLLDDLSPRDEADGRATFTLPGMAFARDGSGGEYHPVSYTHLDVYKRQDGCLGREHLVHVYPRSRREADCHELRQSGRQGNHHCGIGENE